MSSAFGRLIDELRARPTEQQDLLVPVLALAFELYVPGVRLPVRLRQEVLELLASLTLSESESYQDLRAALEARFQSAGLTNSSLRALARSPSRRLPVGSLL